VTSGARLRDVTGRYGYELSLALLLLVVLGAHLAISETPREGLVFDEAFYVPAARDLITGIATNVEHPPLAKGLVALSILAFGDRAIAWRLPSILAGTIAILLLYVLTRRLADKKTALLAAFLLAFENLWFVHSSIAMLDIVAVTLGLAALLLLVRREWVWTGAVVGLAMLAKETMAVLVVVAAVYAALQSPPGTSARKAAREAGAVLFFVGVSAFVVFMAGLQIYDSAYDAFPTAFAHVARMIRHNRAIAAPAFSDAVHPWQWFSGFTPSGYYVTSTAIGKDLRRTYVQYMGQPNLVVVLLVWLALPFSMPLVKARNPNATLHVVIFAVSWAFFAATAFARITYPYYMLALIPSLCVLVAVFLSRLPRAMVLTCLVGGVLWFLAWFPVNMLAFAH
jgi:predicted membrane-bound dolichyl-phosphate-mannose-protein mannosyltransferase